MKRSAYYLNQLEQASGYPDEVTPREIELMKDCYEMARAIEDAARQKFEADGMTIINDAVKEMRNDN